MSVKSKKLNLTRTLKTELNIVTFPPESGENRWVCVILEFCFDISFISCYKRTKQ